jgi:hypothetical protein
MPGLLGMDEDMQMALLASLLGAASASGVRPGTALARGGLLGMNVYQNRKADRAAGQRQAQEDEFRQWQMDEARRKASDEQARREAMAQAFQGAMIPGQPAQPPVEFGGGEGTRPGMPAIPPSFDPQKFAMGLSSVDPMGAAQMLMPKAQESPYGKIDPKDYTPESLREFARTRDPSVLRTPQKAPEVPLGKVSPSDFTPASVAKFMAGGGTDYSVLQPIDKTPRTTVNIDNAPKLPPNYRWKDGLVGQQVEPIPGGPADTTKEDASRVATAEGRAQIVQTAVTDAKRLVGLNTSGFVGKPLSQIPGTDAADLRRKIDTIKANIGFQELQTMREQSKTGGALGQVAIQELEMLQSVLGSLSQDQSPQELLKSLQQIERRYKNARMIVDKINKRQSADKPDPLGIRR